MDLHHHMPHFLPVQFFSKQRSESFHIALSPGFKLSSGFMLRSHAAIDQQHALTLPGPAPSQWLCSTAPKEYHRLEYNMVVSDEAEVD